MDNILKTVLTPMSLTYEVRNRQILIKNLIENIQSMSAESQSRKSVTGTILDERGEPVIGANIIEKGTTNGTVTDIDGDFTLSVKNGAVLQISYIGYLEQEVSTTGRTSVSIVLQEDTKSLEEVVVVGYGIQKKVNLTGAISTMDARELENRPITQASQALQGV